MIQKTYFEMTLEKTIQKTVPVDIGFTEQGWLCLRMPILLPRKEKASRNYIRDCLYPVLEALDPDMYRYYLESFRDHSFSGNQNHVEL